MKKLAFILLFTTSVFSKNAFASNLNLVSMEFKADTSVTDSVQLTDFIGKYAFEGLPFEYVEVSIREVGKIHIEAGERVGDLAPMQGKPDSFQTPEAVLTFVKDDKNIVTKLIIDTGDNKFEGAKVIKQ